MPSALEQIRFDGQEFIARYPDLFCRREDGLWEKLARWAGFDSDTIWEFVQLPGVPMGIIARATVAKVLPRDLVPIYWGKKQKTPGGLPASYDQAVIPEEVLRLRFDCLCSLMESLPESPVFDRITDPLIHRLHQSNQQLLGYLNGPGCPDVRSRWLDPQRRRAFGCYRLQAPAPDSWQGGKMAFGAYLEMLHSSSVAESWKVEADERMQQLVRFEQSGREAHEGALDCYLACLQRRAEATDEAPDPYSLDLEVRQMEFLLDLGLSLDRVIPNPSKMLYPYIYVLKRYGRQDLIELLGCHFLLGDQRPDSEIARHPEGVVSLAEVLLGSTNVGLRERARSIVRSYRCRREPEERKQKREFTEQQAWLAEGERILEEMREKHN